MNDERPIRIYELRFSSTAFSLDVIKKAAYRFSGRCSFDFRVDDDDIVCTMLFTEPQANETVAKLELDLRNEVLDQDLRESIANETALIRNAILAMAFSKTGLQGADGI